MGFQKKQRILRKKFGKGPMKKKFPKGPPPKSAKTGQKGPSTFKPQHNTSKDSRPPGVSAEAWNKRVPCEGCGSRWHRDCQGRKGGKKGGKGISYCEAVTHDVTSTFLSMWHSLETSEYAERKCLAVW